MTSGCFNGALFPRPWSQEPGTGTGGMCECLLCLSPRAKIREPPGLHRRACECRSSGAGGTLGAGRALTREGFRALRHRVEEWQPTGRAGTAAGSQASHLGPAEAGYTLPDRLWKPGGAELPDTPQVHRTVQTFVKSLGGSRKGGVVAKEELDGLLGGPTTSPTPGSPRWRQSREENRKWETAARRRGAGPGCRIGWSRTAADPGRQTRRRTDRPPGGHCSPPPAPQSENPHAARPQDRAGGAARPAHQGKARSRRGCLGAGTCSSGEGESPAAPGAQRPGSPRGCGSHVTDPGALPPLPPASVPSPQRLPPAPEPSSQPFKSRPPHRAQGGRGGWAGRGTHPHTGAEPQPPPGEGNKFEQRRPAPFPLPRPRPGPDSDGVDGQGAAGTPPPSAPRRKVQALEPGGAGEGEGPSGRGANPAAPRPPAERGRGTLAP